MFITYVGGDMPYQKRSIDSRVDYSLILPVFCLLFIGIVAIYIAVSHDYPKNGQLSV